MKGRGGKDSQGSSGFPREGKGRISNRPRDSHRNERKHSQGRKGKGFRERKELRILSESQQDLLDQSQLFQPPGAQADPDPDPDPADPEADPWRKL